jgi:hypothetical protein
VKKISSSGVRRVPSAFDDDVFVGADSQKGFCFWPLLRFNFRDDCPSGSENEFVDIDSFSDAAPEVCKEVVLVTAAEAPIAAEAPAAAETIVAVEVPSADVSLPTRTRDEASPEFTKELELTVQRGEDPAERAPLLEVREVVPEDQAPSTSLAAFNKSFGTSHRGELLSVGFKTTSVGSKASKILTLWKLPVLVDETGGESSEQPGGAARDSEKGPHPAPEATPSSQGKASSGSTKKVTMQHFSKQGSFLFVTFWRFSDSRVFDLRFNHDFFRIEGSSSFLPSVEAGALSKRLRP